MKKNYRVLVISHTSSYMLGGVTVATWNLISRLEDNNIKAAYASDFPLENLNNTPHFPINIPFSNSTIDKLQGIIKSFSPDLIHFISIDIRTILNLPDLCGNIPWIVTIHSISPYERKLSGFHFSNKLHYLIRNLIFLPNTLFYKFAFSRKIIPKIIVHSTFMKQLVHSYGYPADRISLIYLGAENPDNSLSHATEEEISSPPETKLHISTVAGICHTKGFMDVIKMLPDLIKIYGNLQYHIIGEVRDPGYLAELEKEILRKNLHRNVYIHINLPKSDKDRILKKTSLYIQPSHEEGFCLSFLEASLQIEKLIGTATGAIPDIGRVDERIRIVPARDSQAMLMAAKELLALKTDSEFPNHRKKRLLEIFSWDEYARAHAKDYQRNIQEGN